MSEQIIKIKKKDLWKYSTYLLVLVLIIGAFFMFRPDSGANNTNIDAKDLIESNDPVLGDPDAEITIIEFSDFQCVFCAKAFNEGISDFKNSDYFKNGQVNLIYKQMPLDTACNSNLGRQLHPNACKSAEASLCAHEQGKFWEYHDILFANQNALETANLKTYAQQLSLDSTEFNNCFDSEKYKSEVKKEIAQGNSAGGTGTPFFIIVNTKTNKATSFSGAYPFAEGTTQYSLEGAIKAVQ